MSEKPYASAIGSLMYVTLCTERDIFYTVGIVSRYKPDFKVEYWIIEKTYTQVSKEKEGLYVGVFYWESWNTWLYGKIIDAFPPFPILLGYHNSIGQPFRYRISRMMLVESSLSTSSLITSQRWDGKASIFS